MLGIIERHRDRVIERAILPRTRWKPGELAVGRRPGSESRLVEIARRAPTQPLGTRGRAGAQGAERRAAILAATVRILAARRAGRGHPPRGSPEEAGVPLAATTYYFSSKDELVGEALSILVEDEIERLSTARGASSASGCARRRTRPRRVADVALPAMTPPVAACWPSSRSTSRRPGARACDPTAAHWQARVHLSSPTSVARPWRALASPARLAPLLVAGVDGILVHELSDGITGDGDLDRYGPGSSSCSRSCSRAEGCVRRARLVSLETLRRASLADTLLPRRCARAKSLPMRAADALCRPSRPRASSTSSGSPAAPTCRPTTRSTTPTSTHIQARHEQGAGHAAEGYAKASGRVGVALATSGPGATNLVTAIADAMMDSVPTVFITGQVRTDLIGTDGFQEADVTGITLPIVKHSLLVTDPRQIPDYIHAAFHIASTGRPGPVLVDIPQDLSRADIDYDAARGPAEPARLQAADRGQHQADPDRREGARQLAPAGDLRRRRDHQRQRLRGVPRVLPPPTSFPVTLHA